MYMKQLGVSDNDKWPFSALETYTFFLKHKVKKVKLLHKVDLPALEKCLYTHSIRHN